MKRLNFNKNSKICLSNLKIDELNTVILFKKSDFDINVSKYLFPTTNPCLNRLKPKLIRDFQYKLFFNGFVENDKKHAGSSAIIFRNNIEVWSTKQFIGKNYTNIYAQYKGLTMGLKAASEFNIKTLLVKSDSSLIHQLNNKLDYNSLKLLNLYDIYKEVKYLERKFDTVEYIHIEKDLNTQTLNLANDAIKDYLSYSVDFDEPFTSDK